MQMAALLGGIVRETSRILHVLSGIALAAIVVITCFDVIMRRAGMPFDFPYEVVCALAGAVVSLVLPQTTLLKTHVCVEYLETKLSPTWFRPVYLLTRCIGIALFVVLSWNAFRLANHFFAVKQHSAVLEIPEFIFPLFLGVGSVVTCLVFFLQMTQKPEGDQK
jgi:TRAP-type C4-dicarboxylate transport system permease small subunit